MAAAPDARSSSWPSSRAGRSGRLCPALRLPTDGSVLVTGPLSHSAPFIVATRTADRQSLVVMTRFDATETFQLVERQGSSGCPRAHDDEADLAAPRRRAPRPDVSSLRSVCTWPRRARPGSRRRGSTGSAPMLCELYGGTEAQATTVITGREWLEHRGSVGRPIIGEIEVRDDDGRGAAAARSARSGCGAEQDLPRLPLRRRRPRRGGRVGVARRHGLARRRRLPVPRRPDADMILVGGANVYPAEVEAALDEHPAVRSCV